MSIKAIIFDFYGVICSEIGSPWYQQRVSAPVRAELKEHYDRPSNLGDISEDNFFDGIGKAVNLSRDVVRKEWTDAVVINQELVLLIRDLKKTYKTGLCSNTQPKLFRQILKENDLEGLFDAIISSSEIGMVKPHPEIFKYTLEQLHVLASEAVFVDDRTENVQAAASLGIRSLLYRDVATLRKTLNELVV